MGLSSHRRRRRRAVDGEQLLALGAAAVAEAGREARAEAGRAKEDGVGRAAVVVLVAGASPPAVANFPALQLDEGLAHRVKTLTRAIVERLWCRAARGAPYEGEEQHARDQMPLKTSPAVGSSGGARVEGNTW